LTKTLIFIWTLSIFLTSCNGIPDAAPIDNATTEAEQKLIKERQDAIISEHLFNGAMNHHYYTAEWQTEIDKGIAKDSTIAYLWQQKAMPLFKLGKYEVGMEFIDKAVTYDREKWQDYRAFIKCIFAKTYREAIVDFEDYKSRFGYGYVMDHTYDFHIALSYLQLNEFAKAEEIFAKDYKIQLAERGEDWMHPVDIFYYGISKYEQGKYEEAIQLFDEALEIHTQFSEVQYYKSICLRKLGKLEAAAELYRLAWQNGTQGYTFNEDNVIYERYPYQVRWELNRAH